MVAAGWTYDPSPEYDDGVTCMYCNLSLDGWEPKDDPHAEHQKRCPDCPFFSLVDEWAATRQQAKGRKGKGRGSRVSKGSRLSSQSVVSVASEFLSQESAVETDEPAAEDDSVLTTATTATTMSTTARGKKKAAAKGGRKGGRGKKATTDDSVMEVELPTQNEVSSIGAPVKPTRKASRTKKALVIEEVSAMDVDVHTQMDYPTIVDEPPKRQTRRKASKAEQPPQSEDTLTTSEVKRPARGRPTKTKQHGRFSDDESQLHSELQAAIEASNMSIHQPERSARGTKRTSDGIPKFESSVVVLHTESSASRSQTTKSTRGRKAKGAVGETESQDEPQLRSSNASEIPQRLASMPKAPPKSRKGKKAARAPTPELEPESERELPPEIQDEDVHVSDALDDLEAEKDDDFDFGQSLVNPSNPYAPITGTPDHSPGKTSPAPASPTPVRAQKPSAATRALSALPAPTPRKSMQPQSATPVSSPNSSDVENKPPSSRPASVRPPLSIQRVPLAPASPNKQLQLSPSKRNIGGGLKTALPWSAIDLEEVFLNSPVKRNLGLESVITSDKGNGLHMPGVDVEHLDSKRLNDVVKRVKDVLNSEQKGMTVEQWVRWNAQISEEKLRRDCEGLVMLFETEGGRALRTLEGIECMP